MFSSQRRSKRFHTFIANRLAIIHENSTSHHWRHVGFELNPADDASKGLSIDEMNVNSRRFNGPQFLTQSEKSWPLDRILPLQELTDEDPEVKHDL